jgi:hypothetical protein
MPWIAETLEDVLFSIASLGSENHPMTWHDSCSISKKATNAMKALDRAEEIVRRD